MLDGLLQTREYARAVMPATDPDASDEQLSRWLEVRMLGQAFLQRGELEVIVNEAACRQVVGGPAVMAGQIRHVLTLSERFRVRVLPFDAGAHASPDGGFGLLDPAGAATATGTGPAG